MTTEDQQTHQIEITLYHPETEEPEVFSVTAPAKIQELRTNQLEFLQLARMAFAQGKKVFIAEMPTGSGKSLSGSALAEVMDWRCVYCTITKQLQSQLVEEFEDAATLYGKANYVPTNPGSPDITCADCDASKAKPCSYCPRGTDSCPYQIARADAIANPTAILNTALWLSIQNYTNGGFGAYTPEGGPDRELIVFDEGDCLDGALSNFISVEIAARHLQRWGINGPDPDSLESQLNWLKAIQIRVSEESSIKPEAGAGYANSLRQIRWAQNLSRALAMIVKEWPTNNWVMVSDGRKENSPVSFSPVDVSSLAKKYCWRHTSQSVIMSGTMRSPEVMARMLGLSLDEIFFYAWDSPFPLENRPAYYWPVGSLNRKNEEKLLPALLGRIETICKAYHRAGESVMVHGISQARCQKIAEHLRRCGMRPITYSGRPGERDQAIELFKSRPGQIIVGQSLARGVDCPDDQCRANIIAKVPYLDLSNPLVARRKSLPFGDSWYSDETMAEITQMYGRPVRHARDWGHTYILDGSFSYLRSQAYTPKYFDLAIQRVADEDVPAPLRERGV